MRCLRLHGRRAILQHLHVVIRLEHEHIRRANAFEHQFRHVTEVGGKTDVADGRVQQITDRVLRVVRDGEGVHQQVADFKARAGFEQPAIEFCFELEFKRLLRGAVAINRDVQFGGDADEALNVVAVFVRDEDGGEFFRHPADFLEAFADLARAEPGVHEHAGLAGFEVGAIAAGTAAENGEFDFGHYLSIHYPANS